MNVNGPGVICAYTNIHTTTLQHTHTHTHTQLAGDMQAQPTRALEPREKVFVSAQWYLFPARAHARTRKHTHSHSRTHRTNMHVRAQTMKERSHASARVRACMQTCVCARRHVCVHACAYAHMHGRTHVRLCSNTHTRTGTCCSRKPAAAHSVGTRQRSAGEARQSIPATPAAVWSEESQRALSAHGTHTPHLAHPASSHESVRPAPALLIKPPPPAPALHRDACERYVARARGQRHSPHELGCRCRQHERLAAVREPPEREVDNEHLLHALRRRGRRGSTQRPPGAQRLRPLRGATAACPPTARPA